MKFKQGELAKLCMRNHSHGQPGAPESFAKAWDNKKHMAYTMDYMYTRCCFEQGPVVLILKSDIHPDSPTMSIYKILWNTKICWTIKKYLEKIDAT